IALPRPRTDILFAAPPPPCAAAATMHTLSASVTARACAYGNPPICARCTALSLPAYREEAPGLPPFPSVPCGHPWRPFLLGLYALTFLLHFQLTSLRS